MTEPAAAQQGNTQWFGEVPVQKNGTMTLPKEARGHLKLDLEGPDRVLVFVTEPGQVTVTSLPPNLPAALLRLAADAAAGASEAATTTDADAEAGP